MNWQIRDGSAADAVACMEVYVDAVRNGTGRHYSAAQAMAWAPTDNVEDWLPPRLAAGQTWIGWSDRRAEGFLTVTRDGHLDFFFVRPEARPEGLADALYERMMDWAETHDLAGLTTDASHLARSFLEKRGWRMIEGETTIRHGVSLKRWKMAWQRSSRKPMR
ncbi:GNAT family N-acetyltransferase [Aliiruegeria sabulilitoris]|uniref:GNAT family N-acetyltransferase n=1 Tax=Aliiruegeria sabulilitoris TaxID=1510458 RepID=UPI00082CE4E9|nr:GNAT family N-acetyltransferase [Aliiruegeria sabulilitoris]NDR56123.1 GNAT family N-acetyltransferase [Pseudoruegeria sp. M32A2M]